ncbi:5-formaminoimidazole-4-carboxamide-1-(beta)-D-ribofuranosyl 5'-monophosphate synthetase [Candidatus Roizmanbacteria bacterium CG_4_9_14_3_um_filter_33_18]|uniref:5-formaminoimidazole-4-carboxamide-1-(Beta)-D-ribofuranosyl 5'-monophosphate synthetase n=2 Tax=Candidatus Roizmaniibacteriota TaxID=1752723 RepID=A0A2M7XX69_9BACT|nr:MAG: 5-formaminoimidazole-4-carboxamide-1-(beta)-D-ribofuranosyl 5'-monophosphate synthetase [Candidatus Roizmanbacteria bacterium CG22_combo_CG10-13_8_21_14_all_34_12]PJA55333.1 MAG: 5-formaminoimidazole-4-carboxamide-1-(beta)-D-ribofuranosyl 5'-monophosphate synthetase [Candidatus Roizmanbacteria bacterium CG_4_9_14_3_um_filter_33_18]
MNNQYTIATLGSHSALQILKGAHDEGFKTLVIALNKQISFYKRYSFIDEIIGVDAFSKFPEIEEKLKDKKIIVIPHGSFVAYLGMEGNKKMTLPYFGNKRVLDFEFDRVKQGNWLKESGINTPKEFKNIEEVEFPVIIKSFGAAGGKGYFLVNNKQDLIKKIETFKGQQYVIQQYVVGVSLYIHYFYSSLTNKLEIMSMDRRYETNVDALGRLPFNVPPSYVVVGNSPLVLRESMLPEAYSMGEKVVKKSQELIGPKGLFGPFCLETIITPDQKFYVIEISARIVAGTNLFIEGSPYADLLYNEPMSTGRRIAREIKNAIKQNKLDQILD